MFILLTLLSTFISIMVGVDNLVAFSVGEYFTYQLLPSSVFAVPMYALMAKRDKVKAWKYAASVFLCEFFLGTLIVSLILQKLYISSAWFIDLPMLIGSAIVGTIIGIKWSFKGAVAT